MSNVTSIPPSPGVLYQIQDSIGAPRVRHQPAQVCEVHRHLGPPSYLQGLPEGIEEPVPQRVPDVRVVKAPQPRGLLTQCHQLVSIGKAARRGSPGPWKVRMPRPLWPLSGGRSERPSPPPSAGACSSPPSRP